jgi:fanconi-associated nuclease 1
LWLPVSGMLPVACLAGPLDLGRSGFRVRRRAAFDKRIRALEAGQAKNWMKKSLKARGVRIRGLDWGLATDQQWQQLALCLPGEMLAGTMRILGEEGFAAASGLPDLFLWPGKAQRLSFSFPQKIPSCAMLVEVKGPGDDLKDNQRVWHDRMVDWNFPIEVWHVEELDSFYAHHRRTVERAKITRTKGRGGTPDFRPGPGGTLFDLGSGVERLHSS